MIAEGKEVVYVEDPEKSAWLMSGDAMHLHARATRRQP